LGRSLVDRDGAAVGWGTRRALRAKIYLVFAGCIPGAAAIEIASYVGYLVLINGTSGESGASDLQLICNELRIRERETGATGG
jgi:hypothetical protein